jgi:uncharacterized SAM-binding protein YcdF (DUF218 family)
MSPSIYAERVFCFALKCVFRVVAVILIAVAALIAVAWFYPEKFLCVDSGPAKADVIVVLGGGQHERPLRAAELFRQQAAPRVLISGAGDDGINRQLLLQNGVPGSCIEIEGKSVTTHENAEFTIARLRAENVRTVILVTSWYHSRRALKTFEHYAPEMKFYSRPSYYGFDREEWPKHGNGRRMRWEFLKLPGYWIRYGINPF